MQLYESIKKSATLKPKGSTLKGRFSIIGITRGKEYTVIDTVDNTYYKVVLDSGDIALRHWGNFCTEEEIAKEGVLDANSSR